MRIGMVSTRFAGVDGVSLEATKLAEVLRGAGHDVAWFAGELGEEFTPGFLHPPAHFLAPANLELQAQVFGTTVRSPEASVRLNSEAANLRAALANFTDRHEIEALSAHNVLSIPLQLPLAIAITEFVQETGMRVVGHHHDFSWERERFQPNAVQDLIDTCLPPSHPAVRHVVINTVAQESLAHRRGLEATVLPNVMDFESGPPPVDGDAFRAYAGFGDGDRVLLQPTRVIPRKGIETSLELAARLGDVALVVTHGTADEGDAYPALLRSLAERLDVDLRFAPVGERDRPTLGDAYAAADLVAYPSRIEGFGNALLEAFFYRRPVLVNRYEVYVRDIAPAGVECIEIDGALTDEAVAVCRRMIDHPEAWESAAGRNYDIGLRHFSYGVVRERLLPLFE